MQRCSRSFLLVTLLLLMAPAIGMSCELASALCGLDRAAGSGVEALPCHGMPDMAMDCCSIEAPAERPPAAVLGDSLLQAAPFDLRAVAPLSPSLVSTGPLVSSTSERAPDSGRYALLSVYLL